MKRFCLIVLAVAMSLVSCERIVFLTDEEDAQANKGSATLCVNASVFELLPFGTRASQSLKDVSQRISFALFQMDGEKVMNTRSQTSNESGFGTLNASLNPGQYVLVTVAHNGAGNCTISSPTEVKFKDNKVTDTFSSCDTLDVVEGEQTVRIALSRRVAMMRLLLEEELPDEVAQLKFYYTGGSSTLDADAGYGSVNSRQTEILGVPATAYQEKGSTYEVYTFPHAERDTLKVTITALSDAGTAVAERELVNVPVERGVITQFRGKLIGSGGDTPGLQIELTVDDADWREKYYKF